MYSWVKLAFGPKWGLCVVYLQWVFNIVWYPAVLTLIASTVAYLFEPSLVKNSNFMAVAVLASFWLCTLINIFGMRLSSLVSSFGSIIGTLLPMFTLIILAILWLNKGNAPNIAVSLAALPPNINNLAELVFFSYIVYSLLGLELSSVHAMEVKNPKKDFPTALVISAIIILLSLVCASVAVAVVVPAASLDNLTGIIQTFNLFAKEFEAPWLAPFMAMAILIGGLCAVATWIIGSTKGLFAAACDGMLPKFLAKTNKKFVPVNMLLVQGIICTLVTLGYLFIPTVEEAYFVLSALTAQLAMCMYVILFAAALKLRYSYSDTHRPYKIPGKNFGIWVVGGLGIITCLFVIYLGFIPPSSKIAITNIKHYELALLLGILLFLSPIIFSKFTFKFTNKTLLKT